MKKQKYYNKLFRKEFQKAGEFIFLKRKNNWIIKKKRMISFISR